MDICEVPKKGYNIENIQEKLKKFLDEQEHQDLLRFITCGSVDDGKSTLIGRLLWESKQLFEDKITELKIESKKYGTQGDELDFALLVDGLVAEREQGITIDVAYRFFATPHRKFIVADTPGHEQYTRNMVTGASTTELALLLVDSAQGLLTQTRRHAYLASLMGIPHIVLAINKMDLVNFDQSIFKNIEHSFYNFAQKLKFESITSIPLCALKGDNITQASTNMPWYYGPTLMHYLETIKLSPLSSRKFIFPVQWVNRPNAFFRGFSGSIAQGHLSVGDKLRVTRSGQTAKVTEIITMGKTLPQAFTQEAVTLILDKEIDISRGDVLSLSQDPLETTDQFEAILIWMDQEEGFMGRSYDIKLATQGASATITRIKHRIEINELTHLPAKKLQLNDISLCNIALNKSLAFDTYQNSKTLGSFILIDRFTHVTVAAGIIQHSLRRAHNIHTQALSITRAHREMLNGHTAKVIWLTGLSGSGKSTLANALEVELHTKAQHSYILDGDNVRQGLNKDLGFTNADRVENIRRITEVAKLMMDAGLIVITAFISPFRREREMARELIGKENFLEIYVNTPLEICEQRDTKGLYQKARKGELPNMPGIDAIYEAPKNPHLIIKGEDSIQESVKAILNSLFSFNKNSAITNSDS